MTALQPIPDFSTLRVAVVGDLVADHYLFGEPVRLSREAPVMVLRHRGEEFGAGGAANAARNLRSLGAQVRALGVVAKAELPQAAHRGVRGLHAHHAPAREEVAKIAVIRVRRRPFEHHAEAFLR